ncbi:MAG TPA: proton-conducting transporter membrane subunit, partial [Candidatus Limnocylindria bacterium]|nr:proton-conducting transporter membrane subunit [Candidatus Limnocylindria bacterium]
TAFLFFEVLSFTSSAWVVHEETPGAIRAGQTYLAIAIFGGMVMLMGLMMLQQRLHTLKFYELAEAAHHAGEGALLVPGLLILTGFGAKAGMVPLHVWLPKAHPVAPAPASALLSGILTKVGVFGILAISTRMFHESALWGNLLLILGLSNMLLGAVLALFSVDLKRTLACSSMSQIGFILFGVGMQSLLGEHNALAAQGTVLHMVNHSLIKLVLFLCAGAVYLGAHSLDLNDIRGYGRGKPVLTLSFLAGAASISGIPLFSGYASKTLLHESLVEYIEHLHEHHLDTLPYQAAEWVFLLSGGITLCYMLKLFIALFVQKPPAPKKGHARKGHGMNALQAAAVGSAALVLLALGIWPEGPLTAIANRALPFLRAHAPEHAVHYLTWANLSGAAKSVAIGVVLYLTVARGWLAERDTQGALRYVNRWPRWLDLEELVYRPAVKGAVRLGYLVSEPFDHVMVWVIRLFMRLGRGAAEAFDHIMDIMFGAFYAGMTFFSRVLEAVTESFSLFLMKTVYRPRKEHAPVPTTGNRVTFALGRTANALTAGTRRALGMQPPERDYVALYAGAWAAAKDTFRRFQRTLSFSLLLFALGLVILLAMMLAR